jgi:predicted house-cleaning noncanonical NTP pyrophosphatase (MazG superfamily)
MKRKYNKLIRDKIPEVIRGSGRPFECSTLPRTEYLHALGEKLVEEAQEAAIALEGGGAQGLVDELADLYEVIDTILAVREVDKSQAIARQIEKRELRGGFQKGIKLDWVEEEGDEGA